MDKATVVMDLGHGVTDSEAIDASGKYTSTKTFCMDY